MKILITERQRKFLKESQNNSNSLDKSIEFYENNILEWRYKYAVNHQQEFFDIIYDNFIEKYINSSEYNQFINDLKNSIPYKTLMSLYRKKYPKVKDVESQIWGDFNLDKDSSFDFIYDLKLIPKKPDYDSLDNN